MNTKTWFISFAHSWHKSIFCAAKFLFWWLINPTNKQMPPLNAVMIIWQSYPGPLIKSLFFLELTTKSCHIMNHLHRTNNFFCWCSGEILFILTRSLIIKVFQIFLQHSLTNFTFLNINIFKMQDKLYSYLTASIQDFPDIWSVWKPCYVSGKLTSKQFHHKN